MYNFMKKKSVYISIILLIVTIILFFVPYVHFINEWSSYTNLDASPFQMVKHGIEYTSFMIELTTHPEEGIVPIPWTLAEIWEMIRVTVWVLLCFVSCVTILSLSIIFHKKTPMLFLWILLPLSVIFGCALYVVGGWVISYQQIPHVGIFLISIEYFFCLFIFGYYLKNLHKKYVSAHPPKPHNPTKSERIAELERQASELKQQVSELSANKKDTD